MRMFLSGKWVILKRVKGQSSGCDFLLKGNSIFSSRIPLKPLSILCRSLGTMLRSGVPLKRALKTATGKVGHSRVRNAMEGVRKEIGSGSDFATAIQHQEGAFPELMVDMIRVAEETGGLPEVLNALSDHYSNLVKMKNDFIKQITWPVLQLVAAVFVIGLLIFVLGMISQSTGEESMDILGWGLKGTSGAITWFVMTFGGAFAVFILYRVVSNSLAGKRSLDRFLLKIPIIGHCSQSFAISRFSWAFHLTQEAGMPIGKSLTASMKATGNGAFISKTDELLHDITEGEHLSDALRNTQLFPEEFLEMVYVGETSGTVPEKLHEMSPEFEESARRSLAALAGALGWVIWLGVAIFIGYVVISIMMSYIKVITELSG